MAHIRIWSGSGQERPSSSLLERARDIKIASKGYRMEDGSLLIVLDCQEEQVKLFEEILNREKFSKVAMDQGGIFKKGHYIKTG